MWLLRVTPCAGKSPPCVKSAADPTGANATRGTTTDVGRARVVRMAKERELEVQLCNAHLPKELRLFTAEEGAEAHSQVITLRLAQHVVFDWLDEVVAG